MIIKTIRRTATLFHRQVRCFSKQPQSSYTAPASQLQEFKKHLQNLQDQKSLQKAAELMSQLEVDQELYRDSLISLNSQKQQLAKENSRIVKIVEQETQIQSEIDNQIAQNKLIEARCFKEMQNIKVYGITNIAKQVIEIADHISLSIKMLKNRSGVSQSELKELESVQKQLNTLFRAYNIHEFDPKGEAFNPNQHESIGQIPAQNPEQKKLVAQTQRTGFKLKDRLLRSAYVMIYT